MSNAKHMRMSLPEGGEVFLAWPENISLESLELAEEVIELQLRSVRKAIERKKAELAAASLQSDTAQQKDDKGGETA